MKKLIKQTLRSLMKEETGRKEFMLDNFEEEVIVAVKQSLLPVFSRYFEKYDRFMLEEVESDIDLFAVKMYNFIDEYYGKKHY